MERNKKGFSSQINEKKGYDKKGLSGQKNFVSYGGIGGDEWAWCQWDVCIHKKGFSRYQNVIVYQK